jgi:hypothetical protein
MFTCLELSFFPFFFFLGASPSLGEAYQHPRHRIYAL